jgi:hypothetical protein
MFNSYVKNYQRVLDIDYDDYREEDLLVTMSSC